MKVFGVFSFSKAGVAQLVEQLTCNQQVVGSTPIASSILSMFRKAVFFVKYKCCLSSVGQRIFNSPFAGVPEWPNGSDCKSDAKASVVRIHPPAPYVFLQSDPC